MAVFANLIPGVREVRAQLAAGGIFLLAVALAVEPNVPSRSSATGLAASIFAVTDGLGPLGRGIIIAFTAYLIGSVLQSASAAFHFAASFSGPILGPSILPIEGQSRLEPMMSERVESAFREIEESFGWSLRTMAKAGFLKGLFSFGALNAVVAADARGEDRDSRLFDSDIQAVSEPLAERVAKEHRITQLRLLGAEPEWFGEVDRLQAEAELRDAILLPLLSLGLVCALRASGALAGVLIFGAVALFTALLFTQANRRRRQANNTLIDAVIVGRVNAPAFERFEADLATAVARGKAASRDFP